ncbi:nephrocystin-3-like [Argonauta hians]
MGTGSSFLHSPDDDDIIGADCDHHSHGVIKRIPIEMKPRGRLGLRKPKDESLRSIDLDSQELERKNKEFEMYRRNKEQEIANMLKKEQKLINENKKFRAELLALQKTCTKLRGERDLATQAESQALTRAAAFENDRDKIQRQFKIFRETKESEIQNLLRAKRELESKIPKLNRDLLNDASEDDDSPESGLESVGAYPGDWWTALESEPSLGSTFQLHPTFRGPELANCVMELEGPFTNVNKEDWSLALGKLTQISPTIPEHLIANVVRIFVSISNDSKIEFDMFQKDYAPKLASLCQGEGRTLIVVNMHVDDDVSLSSMVFELHLQAIKKQIQMSNLYLAFRGTEANRFNSWEYSWGHLDSLGVRPAVICLREKYDGTQINNLNLQNSNVRVLNGYNTPTKGAELAYNEIDKILKMELGIDARKEKPESDCGYSELEGPEQLCGGALWDIQCDYEHMVALNSALSSSCELGFEKYYEQLNSHVHACGPQPPLLIIGSSGTGRSLLLAKWTQLHQERYPSCLVMCHFVKSQSSVGADPIFMIRRFTAQLMQHVTSPPALTCNPVRLEEEFPRWLEKVSSRLPGGVVLVLDSIDLFQEAEEHLKWLLDPLPVGVHVIATVNEKTCPQSWRQWATLHLESLSKKNVKELLRAELALFDIRLSPEDETSILEHCQTDDTCAPLFTMVLTRHIVWTVKREKSKSYLNDILSCNDTVDLYVCVLDKVQSIWEVESTKGIMIQILKLLYVCRNGLNENEFLTLVPGLTWSIWTPIFNALCDQLVIKYQTGLVMPAHEQAKMALYEFCFNRNSNEDDIFEVEQKLIDYFSGLLRPGHVTCRVADELPWLLKERGNISGLKNCILNLCIFQRLYARGRCAELISHWELIGADKTSMAQEYLAQTKYMEVINQSDGNVSGIADMYETLGRFLKDLGLLSQALPALQRSLEIRETGLDPDHPAVARSLHQLAGLHAQWGKVSTAETLYKQALDIYENALGSEHYLVAKELDALAVLYQKQDKHDLAEPLKRRALLIKKKTRGPRISTGQIRGIDPMVQRRALHLEELSMGPDSAELAHTLNELGVLYYLQNNQEIAESFLKRSLEMREALLGTDHPDIAQSLNNLAALYNDQKQCEKAIPLYERALHIRMKYLPDHPSVASINKHLAVLYKKLGQYSLAEPLYRQAVDIRERSFGKNHPAVATALVNLAVLFSQQNKYEDAEPLYERALKIYEDSFGQHHPRVAETLRNLAVMKFNQEDYKTAARLYKRATEIKETEASYTGKDFSRCSSGGDTNSTVKNSERTVG